MSAGIDPSPGQRQEIVSSTGALRWSERRGIEWASPAMAGMLGCPAESLAGTTIERHVHSDDRVALAAALRAVASGARAETALSIRLLRGDGQPIWTEAYALPAAPEDASTLLLLFHRVEEEMQAVEMLNRRTREQVSLLHLLQDLLRQRDLQSILNTVADQARLLLKARECTLFLLQPDGRTIRAVAASGDEAAPMLAQRLQLGEGLTGWVIEHGIPQRVEAGEAGQRNLADVPPGESGSLLCGPLVHGEHTMGALLLRGAPGSFADSDLEFLAGLGQVASLAIANSRVFDEVLRKATLDDLTGAFNRSFLASNLPAEINLGQRLGHGVGLLVARIDDLDAVNGGTRHSVADALLVTLVEVARRIIRDTDWVARYGGDAFAVVLPGCPADRLAELARRIRREFLDAAAGMPHGRPAEVRLSIGGSAYPECTMDPNALLADAEEARREAAAAGDEGVVIRPARCEADATHSPTR